MKTIKLLAVAAVAWLGCGDNKSVPDARVPADAPPDAYCSDCPAAPTLGAQIDRMGRPAVNTALNHGFDPTAAAETAKEDYNEDGNKANWGSYVPEFMTNLAIIDVLDTGVCGNGICESLEGNVGAGTTLECKADCPATGQVGGICGNDTCEVGETNTNCALDCPTADQVGFASTNGCSNQALYAPDATTGAPTATSYGPLATLLSNDEFYLDSSKSACQFYLAVEFGVVTGGGNSTCGGRAPQYDVIDYSFSMLAMGLKGFDTSLQPLVKDGANVHADVSADTFPFLGDPH